MAAQFPRTIKPNCPPTATPAQKAVLFELVAPDIPNGPPTQGDGTAGVRVPPDAVNLDLFIEESDAGVGSTFDAKVWWCYPDAGVAGNGWIQDLAVGTLAVARGETVREILVPSAASRIYVEIDNLGAGAPKASAWVIGRGSMDKGR